MDFFERFLHISPDGGSGATEAIYIAAVLIALALVRRPGLNLVGKMAGLRRVCKARLAR